MGQRLEASARATWSASGALMTATRTPEYQACGAALQIVLIGVALAAVLLLRPRGLLDEDALMAQHEEV